jgi:hypothetical protein
MAAIIAGIAPVENAQCRASSTQIDAAAHGQCALFGNPRVALAPLIQHAPTAFAPLLEGPGARTIESARRKPPRLARRSQEYKGYDHEAEAASRIKSLVIRLIHMSQTQVPSVTAAANLVGAALPGGWRIVEQIPRPGNAGAEDQTGSWFSIGYIATDGKKKAFVKVIDVQRALESSPGVPLIERLRRLTESHTFECAILDICGKAGLDRIVRVSASALS